MVHVSSADNLGLLPAGGKSDSYLSLGYTSCLSWSLSYLKCQSCDKHNRRNPFRNVFCNYCKLC